MQNQTGESTAMVVALRERFPEATEAECKRFLLACENGKKSDDEVEKEAIELLSDYLAWRKRHGLDSESSTKSDDAVGDASDWNYATKKAFLSGASEDRSSATPNRLSQFIFLHDLQKEEERKPIRDKNGNPILHVMPGMIDRKASTAETYGLAISLYLDRKLNRESCEKMTVLLDVRAGHGWPNPTAFEMIGFVRKVTKIVQAHYPERCDSLIIFPVPRVAMSLWHAMKLVFRHGMMDKVALIPGPADRDSPLPKSMLEEFIDSEVLEITEQERSNRFML